MSSPYSVEIRAVSLALTDKKRGEYREALRRGRLAGMDYLEASLPERLFERDLLSGQKSALLVALPYPALLKSPHIAPYALFEDYHRRAKGLLKKLSMELQTRFPGIGLRPFCDAEPVPEKPLAVGARLGFMGRNTLIIHPRFGTRFFICGLLTDRPVSDFTEEKPAASAEGDSCGDCRICIDACPTGALSMEGLDCRTCISFHTIENRGEIPGAIARKLDGRVFGCGICEEVCPRNRNLRLPEQPDWPVYRDLAAMDLARLETEVRKSFRALLGRTPASRLGKRLFLRNLASAMGKEAEK